jgi:hypothetical protein
VHAAVSFGIVWAIAAAVASDRYNFYEDITDDDNLNTRANCGLSGIGPVAMGPAFILCVVTFALCCIQLLVFIKLRSTLRTAGARRGYAPI